MAEAVKDVDRALIVMGNHSDQARPSAALWILRPGQACLTSLKSLHGSPPEATAELPKTITIPINIWRRAGLTFLRPNYYMQNMLMYAASISRAGQFALPLRVQKPMVDARDVGAVSAVILMEEGIPATSIG